MLPDNIQKKAKQIKLVIFDVDGVMTDGGLLLGDDGQQYKIFNSKDGQGLRILQDSGVLVAIITGRHSQVVEHRMQELGIQHIYQGQRDKLNAFEDLCQKTKLQHDEMAYVGDDLPDLPIMRRVGLSIAVQNAEDAVKQQADWTSNQAGGQGAVREVCNLIMQAQNTLDAAIEKYLI